MDDEFFVELVTALQKYQPAAPADPDPLFGGLSRVFPDLGSPLRLRDRFVNLTKPKASVPNLDGSEAQSLPVKAVMNSFHTLLCRRCFKYDCSLHGLPTVTPDRTTKRKKPDLPLPTQPCGESCHLHQRQGTPDPPSPFCGRVEEAEWDGGEMSLFRVLSKVFPGHFCLISKTLKSKSCREVHDFSSKDRSENPELYEQDETPPSFPAETQKSNNNNNKLTSAVKKRRLYPPKWMEEAAGSGGKKRGSGGSSTVPRHYMPCHHPGRPCDQDCPCVEKKYFCEKFCQCGPDCRNAFPGCQCTSRCGTKKCPCLLGNLIFVSTGTPVEEGFFFFFNCGSAIAFRECDPDLCQKCGAGNIDLSKVVCRNVMIQRGLAQDLVLASSDVAGWGIFLRSSVDKNVFISEYCGEIISQEEADQRGKVYDKCKSSFLFNLNYEFVVDATRKGNKIRFANHSFDPNCYAKVLKVMFGFDCVPMLVVDFFPLIIIIIYFLGQR